jgi:hypothetical protein
MYSEAQQARAGSGGPVETTRLLSILAFLNDYLMSAPEKGAGTQSEQLMTGAKRQSRPCLACGQSGRTFDHDI